jgi:geranylgeranyl pyrophosphate synthase
MQCAGKYVNDAKGMLNIFPESTEKNQLFAVADYILSREI